MMIVDSGLLFLVEGGGTVYAVIYNFVFLHYLSHETIIDCAFLVGIVAF